jgi:hypothetical protein
MTMDRRDFLKLCSGVGIGVASTGLTFAGTRQAWGEKPIMYVMVYAGGGWDTTMLCDPKGGEINPEFTEGEFGQTGNIVYAPTGNNQAFFERFKDQMVVINGINTQTNGHDVGTRNSGAGDLRDGFPAFAALVAAAKSEGKPMGFITNGGYDETAGVIGATRFGNLNVIQELIHPNRITANNDDSPTYHTEAAWNNIKKARQERLKRMQETQQLPRMNGAQSLLYSARLGDGKLAPLLDYLPEQLSPNGLARQAEVALAAYKAGLTTAVNLSQGGFDTHSNNFNTQQTRLTSLTDGVTALFNRAEELNIADELFVVMCSEFGRSPKINDGNGKDHYAVGSMICMGSGVKGNRVVGATDEKQAYKKVDPKTLEATNTGGVTMTNAHIHRALREHAGIAEMDSVSSFQLKAEESLPILTG